jgi:hypothetical protein
VVYFKALGLGPVSWPLDAERLVLVHDLVGATVNDICG